MKLLIQSLSAAGILITSILCAEPQEESDKQNSKDPDYTFSGTPHAKDTISTVEAIPIFDKDFASENLSLEIDGRLMSITTNWSNGVAPKDLRLKEDQRYRVTLIHDDRLHPGVLWGKYGTNFPIVSRIESLKGEVIYDASICPMHKKKAQRRRLTITEDFSDRLPSAIRLREFPYGMDSYPTLIYSWAPDTRVTVLEFVCDECLEARAAYLKNNSSSEQVGADQPATASESGSDSEVKPQPVGTY